MRFLYIYFKVYFFEIYSPFCLIFTFTDKVSKMEGIDEIFQDTPVHILPTPSRKVFSIQTSLRFSLT